MRKGFVSSRLLLQGWGKGELGFLGRGTIVGDCRSGLGLDRASERVRSGEGVLLTRCLRLHLEAGW